MYKVGVIGLGYVGMPLAKRIADVGYKTIGFDINSDLIEELNNSYQSTPTNFIDYCFTELLITNDPTNLNEVDIFIITVPTPINSDKTPDLSHVEKATITVSRFLNKDKFRIVIYESTVYPGCTEDLCIPILEKESGLKLNEHFGVGYSPERINPGDKIHSLENVIKVTSGSNDYTAKVIDDFYKSIIIPAGTYPAPSIKVAEACKLAENIQRDVNIALINELAMIFHKMKIDTHEVLNAAATKWNFQKLTPGLVGGHCISIDPYYLINVAGSGSDLIKIARKVNEEIPLFISSKIEENVEVHSKVLIAGITFKENISDIRNSKVVTLYHYLEDDYIVDIIDPLADYDKVKEEYGISLINEPDFKDYQAIILAVPHREFMNYNWKVIRTMVPYIFDVKGVLPRDIINDRL